MSFNPLAIILSQNKLTKPNYVGQKRNLNIILTIEGYKYILTKERPDLLTTNAPRSKIKNIKNELKMMRWHVAIKSFDVFCFTTSAK